MRCGKVVCRSCTLHVLGRNPRECAVAKMRDGKPLPLRRGRNPRECAVAKASTPEQVNAIKVATRTNALWQRSCLTVISIARLVATRANALWQSVGDRYCDDFAIVATRANALWQRSSHAWMLTTTAGRNPRECAVAKPS